MGNRPGDAVNDPDAPERGHLSPRAARALRSARHHSGLTLADLGSLAGVSPPYASRLERGLRRPSVSVAHALADVLGMGPGERALLVGEATAEHGRDWRPPVPQDETGTERMGTRTGWAR